MDMSDKPPSSSRTKRQHHQEENPVDYAASSTPPSKRPKPMCKYGAKFYLKNADHRSKFAHPVLSKEKEEEKALVSKEIGNVRGWRVTYTPSIYINLPRINSIAENIGLVY